MPVLIGTSGWHYKHWKGGIYPPDLPQSRWLDRYSKMFDTVELNNAFYRLPERSAFERWAEQVPDGFVVTVKASRYLTHIRRLRDPEEPVALLLERAEGLGDRLGPFLLQLPPNLKADTEGLDRALAAFPRSARVAVEFRNPTWFTTECRQILERRGAAMCLADGGPVRIPLWRTAGWGYIRFHRGRASPETCYGRRALRSWADRLAADWAADETVYAYFNNDPNGCAPRDAHRFASAITAVGLVPSRVPGPRETPLTG